jgi:hypothetical protein
MQKSCRQCSASFLIRPWDEEFYKMVETPIPTLCPDCRLQRRFAFRNERHLYRRTCDLTGKSIISVHHAIKPFPVYDHHEWWGDRWDGLEYGRDFDFSRPFFEQFAELENQVPHMSMMISHSENCDYAPYSVYAKNCYMCVSCNMGSEDLMYSYQANTSRDCLDCSLSSQLELCYECLYSQNLFASAYSKDCRESQEIFFCEDCTGCNHLIGCKDLKNKKYHIFNKPVSPEEFTSWKEKLENWKFKVELAAKTRAFFMGLPNRATYITNSEESSGDHLTNCKNAFWCFDCFGLEDCAYINVIPRDLKNASDANYSQGSELVYDSVSAVNNYLSKFVLHAWDVKNSSYVQECFYSNSLFGCVGLKHKSYCILNKQYSKEEYEILVPKIIDHMNKSGEWGEFFPIELSPFAYNETIAQEYFPLKKEEVVKQGWKWKESEEPDFSNVSKKIPAEKLPDSIQDIPDDILNWAIECAESRRLFKIQKAELEFYRKMNLPIPHFHPDVRHAQRMTKRNPRTLWNRNCMKCGQEIQTTYSPDRPEIVYCEECYLKTVY